MGDVGDNDNALDEQMWAGDEEDDDQPNEGDETGELTQLPV